MEPLGYTAQQGKRRGFISTNWIFFFFWDINIIRNKEGSSNKNVSTLELLNLVQQV